MASVPKKNVETWLNWDVNDENKAIAEAALNNYTFKILSNLIFIYASY